MNDCACTSVWKYHPAFWDVLNAYQEGTTKLLVSDIRLFFQIPGYTFLADRFIWKYSDRRMKPKASINENNEYPDIVWDAFIDNMNVVKQLYFPRIQTLMDAENENITAWMASQREVTAKQYPSPNGAPETAYVISMQTQTEVDNAHMSPDDMERAARYQSAFDAYLDQFGDLFLGVM